MKRLVFGLLLFCFSGTLFAEVPVLTGDLSQPSVPSGQAPRRSHSKNLWADSWLYLPVPLLDDAGKILPETDQTAELPVEKRLASFLKVEEWYGPAPKTLEGKLILVEFSASWCPVCRREIPLLNHWQEKFKDDLIVLSLYETDRKSIDTLPGKWQGKDMHYFVAIDQKRRTANALGVFGIPHVVLLEPQYGGVIWEGLPTQPGFELTDKIIEKAILVSKKGK